MRTTRAAVCQAVEQRAAHPPLVLKFDSFIFPRAPGTVIENALSLVPRCGIPV